MLCQNFIFPLNGGGSIIKQAMFGEKGTNFPEHHFIYLCYCFCFILNLMFFEIHVRSVMQKFTENKIFQIHL